MVERSHLEALRTTHEACTDGNVTWALTGSLSFALQGVPVEPDDVDVQTTEAGAYELERRLSEAVVDPVSLESSDGIRSHFGAFDLAGVRVEVMGALQKRADGAWEPPVDVTDHRRWITVDGLDVPVLSLEYEATAYERLGRHERAALLSEYADR